MCGRYALYSLPHAVALHFGLAHTPQCETRYNIAPGTAVLAVCADARHARGGALLHWGLIPPWAKDPAVGNRLVNVRADTLLAKPSLRTAFRCRRCILPANGYYEWAPGGSYKQPYYIRPKGDELFGFAGLYEHWHGVGGSIESCTIITTDANPLTQPLHARMPAILPVDAYAHWLDADNPDPDSLVALLKPAPDDRMRVHPVSVRVNDIKNEGPMLIEPDTSQQLL